MKLRSHELFFVYNLWAMTYGNYFCHLLLHITRFSSGAEPNILNIRHTLRLSTTSPDSKLFALSNLENFANSVLEDP